MGGVRDRHGNSRRSPVGDTFADVPQKVKSGDTALSDLQLALVERVFPHRVRQHELLFTTDLLKISTNSNYQDLSGGTV